MAGGATKVSTIVAKGLFAIVLVMYPLLVWQGLQNGTPRTIAAVLLCVMLPVAAMRMQKSQRAGLRGLSFVPLITVAALLSSAVLDRAGFLLFVPALINGLFLAVFGSSLRAGSMPAVERFARLQEETLSAEQVAWCRLWTIVWCVFFVANGTTSVVLAVAGPMSWWATYNGLVAYVLMGMLFAIEWTMRRRRFSRG